MCPNIQLFEVQEGVIYLSHIVIDNLLFVLQHCCLKLTVLSLESDLGPESCSDTALRFFFLFILMYMGVCLYVGLCTMCMWPEEVKEGIKSPGTRATDSVSHHVSPGN